MNRSAATSLLLTAAVLLPLATTTAQEPPTTPSAKIEALKVFLDCQTRCDFDHFRRAIPFVNYVRDRQDADLHVLVTAQGTGGGGREFTFSFIGLERFAGREDTLLYVSSGTDTDNEVRDGQTRTLMLGLMPYVANTPIADRIDISYRALEQGDVRQQPEDDSWNFWVFRIGGNGSVFGESRTRFYSVNGNVSANRTTEAWRINVFANGRFSEQRFELDDDETVVSRTTNYRLEGSVVRSIGDHWAAGAEASAAKSTRLNQDLTLRFGSALEYNIFPYAESTRRQLTIFYGVAVARFDYEEITIFDETTETRLEHFLEFAVEAVQPWGEIDASLEGSMFLHDLGRHRIELDGGISIRVVRGLDLRLNGSIARVKNQIYLPGADIPEEDILLRRRQLGTDFEARASFGFSYRFGSIFNNVVNPRMR